MGFRFRKAIRLLPGLRLNLSKGGVSLSAGGKGLAWNIGKRGARATIGAPGTGLSYSSLISGKNLERASWLQKLFIAAVLLAIITLVLVENIF